MLPEFCMQTLAGWYRHPLWRLAQMRVTPTISGWDLHGTAFALMLLLQVNPPVHRIWNTDHRLPNHWPCLSMLAEYTSLLRPTQRFTRESLGFGRQRRIHYYSSQLLHPHFLSESRVGAKMPPRNDCGYQDHPARNDSPKCTGWKALHSRGCGRHLRGTGFGAHSNNCMTIINSKFWTAELVISLGNY